MGWNILISLVLVSLGLGLRYLNDVFVGEVYRTFDESE